jgi:hypothetical protein
MLNGAQVVTGLGEGRGELPPTIMLLVMLAMLGGMATTQGLIRNTTLDKAGMLKLDSS